MARPKNEKATDHIQNMIELGVVGSVFSAADVENKWHKSALLIAPAPVAKHTITRRLAELVNAGLIVKIGNHYERKEGDSK